LSPAARARRDAIEEDIARLRASKKEMAQDAYYSRLETLLLDLARIYQNDTPPEP
jgi:hypothetical protein